MSARTYFVAVRGFPFAGVHVRASTRGRARFIAAQGYADAGLRRRRLRLDRRRADQGDHRRSPRPERGRSTAGAPGRRRRSRGCIGDRMSAREKAPGGMNRVLFVRCDEVLTARIEAARVQMSRDSGVELSTADAVRVLADEAMQERGV
jgi:hypothetical protein